MDSTSFQFFLSIPGDARLVPAIRDLSTHAATYAKLGGDDINTFAQRVADAAESLIAERGSPDAPIEFTFHRTRDSLRVTLTWRLNGSEQRREIEQRTSS